MQSRAQFSLSTINKSLSKKTKNQDLLTKVKLPHVKFMQKNNNNDKKKVHAKKHQGLRQFYIIFFNKNNIISFQKKRKITLKNWKKSMLFNFKIKRKSYKGSRAHNLSWDILCKDILVNVIKIIFDNNLSPLNSTILS